VKNPPFFSRALAAAGWLFALLLFSTPASPQALPYQNPDLPAELRAADLVSRMTLAEKVSQMQNAAAAIPRLGVPAYDWRNEALHGVARAGLATVFPQAIGLAASWDTALVARVADAISTEARAKYHEAQRTGEHGQNRGLTFWAPNINIVRDPRWGRGQETFGEDPLLTGRIAAAFIGAMQGDDPHYLKTVATAKHYAAHSGPEPLRASLDAQVPEQDLEATYLSAFRASVDAGVASVMCAYNSVNGVPACASRDLLQNRLRDAFGFRGYVVSDCDAVADIATGHHYVSAIMQAAAAAVLAGADLNCGTEYATLADAVKAGLLGEPDLDRAVTRLFTARFRLGMFDPPERVPYAAIPYSEVDSAEHRKLALDAALRSIVLLKNTAGALPIAAGVRRIAVVGPSADWPDMQLANYFGTPSHIVTPLQGIRARFGAAAQVSFALGSTYTGISPALVPPEALPGLAGEYFAAADFSGTAALSRADPRVYFNWDAHDPAVTRAIPRDHFSVRWSGTILAPYTGDYVIGLSRRECNDCTGADQARLFIDGQMLVDENTPMSWLHATRGAHVQWTAGSAHQLRIEFRQDHGVKGIELIWIPPADELRAEARRTIGDADIALVFVGLNADLESEESSLQMPGFAHGDRTSLDLPAPQRQLLRDALDTGKPVVIVLTTGSAIVTGVENEAAAILEAWYPGEEGGTAIAQILAGDANPAGRLPVTLYRSVDQLPPFENYSMAGRTYRFFRGDPLYRFGFGLSYSTFRYSRALWTGTRRIAVRVTNTSQRDGDEVVQLYQSGGLADFQRVHIAAGKSRTVEFQVGEAAMAAGRRAIHIAGAPSQE
jgi:beta-glucosidase